jgi:hypothetical protein
MANRALRMSEREGEKENTCNDEAITTAQALDPSVARTWARPKAATAHILPGHRQTRRSPYSLFGALSLLLGVLSVSMLPPFWTHWLKYSRSLSGVPFVLPAAGLPMILGGNFLAIRAEHFFATSAVTAEVPCGINKTATQTMPLSALPNVRFRGIVNLPGVSVRQRARAL